MREEEREGEREADVFGLILVRKAGVKAWIVKSQRRAKTSKLAIVIAEWRCGQNIW